MREVSAEREGGVVQLNLESPTSGCSTFDSCLARGSEAPTLRNTIREVNICVSVRNRTTYMDKHTKPFGPKPKFRDTGKVNPRMARTYSLRCRSWPRTPLGFRGYGPSAVISIRKYQPGLGYNQGEIESTEKVFGIWPKGMAQL